jgi:general stress protein 26
MSNDETQPGSIEQFLELVKEFKFAMFTTSASDGHMHSRPMATQIPQPDSPVWFVSSLDTGKIADLERDPRVNLAYFREGDMAWVSVSGKVRLQTDKQRIKELWQEDWKIYFPEGPDQEDLVLLHVTPEHVTYWQNEQGRIGFMVMQAKAYLTGTEPEFSPVRTVEV